jgi:hypothetical protein
MTHINRKHLKKGEEEQEAEEEKGRSRDVN